MSKPQQVVGSREYVNLLDYHISYIQNVFDTSTKHSVLYIHKLKITDKGKYQEVSFWIQPIPKKPRIKKKISTRIHSWVRITDDHGGAEYKPVVKTRIQIAKRKINALLVLNQFPIAQEPCLKIGSKLLKNRFVVNISEEFLLYKNLSQIPDLILPSRLARSLMKQS